MAWPWPIFSDYLYLLPSLYLVVQLFQTANSCMNTSWFIFSPCYASPLPCLSPTSYLSFNIQIKIHLLTSILRTFLIMPCLITPFYLYIALLLHIPSFISRVYISNQSRSAQETEGTLRWNCKNNFMKGPFAEVGRGKEINYGVWEVSEY